VQDGGPYRVRHISSGQGWWTAGNDRGRQWMAEDGRGPSVTTGNGEGRRGTTGDAGGQHE